MRPNIICIVQYKFNTEPLPIPEQERRAWRRPCFRLKRPEPCWVRLVFPFKQRVLGSSASHLLPFIPPLSFLPSFWSPLFLPLNAHPHALQGCPTALSPLSPPLLQRLAPSYSQPQSLARGRARPACLSASPCAAPLLLLRSRLITQTSHRIQLSRRVSLANNHASTAARFCPARSLAALFPQRVRSGQVKSILPLTTFPSLIHQCKAPQPSPAQPSPVPPNQPVRNQVSKQASCLLPLPAFRPRPCRLSPICLILLYPAPRPFPLPHQSLWLGRHQSTTSRQATVTVTVLLPHRALFLPISTRFATLKLHDA